MINSGSSVARQTRASNRLSSPIHRVRFLVASDGTLESLRQNMPRNSSKRVRKSGFPAACFFLYLLLQAGNKPFRNLFIQFLRSQTRSPLSNDLSSRNPASRRARRGTVDSPGAIQQPIKQDPLIHPPAPPVCSKDVAGVNATKLTRWRRRSCICSGSKVRRVACAASSQPGIRSRFIFCRAISALEQI